jgi:hypothetical protein
VHVLEVPEIVVSGLCLRDFAIRLGLAGVDDIGLKKSVCISHALRTGPMLTNFIESWMKKTGMLFPTMSQLPSSV